MRIRTCILIAISLTILTAPRGHGEQVAPPESNVPEGPAIVLNGTLEEGEWAGAAEAPFGPGVSAAAHANGRTLRFSRNEDRLQVGVAGNEPGFPHIAIARGDTIWILHASAALGSAVYTRATDRWNRIQAPRWEVRDTSMTARAVEEREAYFRRTGWVATTARMGEAGTAEFLIDLRRFGPSSLQLAVAFLPLEPNNQILRWPEDATDDVAAKPLLTGPMPEALNFEPNDWGRLLVSGMIEGGTVEGFPGPPATSRERLPG